MTAYHLEFLAQYAPVKYPVYLCGVITRLTYFLSSNLLCYF